MTKAQRNVPFLLYLVPQALQRTGFDGGPRLHWGLCMGMQSLTVKGNQILFPTFQRLVDYAEALEQERGVISFYSYKIALNCPVKKYRYRDSVRWR